MKTVLTGPEKKPENILEHLNKKSDSSPLYQTESIQKNIDLSDLSDEDLENTSKFCLSKSSDDSKSNEGSYTFVKDNPLSLSDLNLHSENHSYRNTPIKEISEQLESFGKLNHTTSKSSCFSVFNNKSQSEMIKTDRKSSTEEAMQRLNQLIMYLNKQLRSKDLILTETIEKYEKIIKSLKDKNKFLKFENLSLLPKKKFYSTHKKSSKNFSSSEPVFDLSQKKEILYPNGVKSEVYPNGYKVVYYPNLDIKQEFPDGKKIYFFASEHTTKTTYANGLQEIRFSNGQLEKYYPDGTKEIKFVNGTTKCIFYNGEEETVMPDGTIEISDKEGIRTIFYIDGRKETVYNNGKVIKQ